MLGNTGQKSLWTLLECWFDISPKIMVFRVNENSLLKSKNVLNSWKRKFKMNLLTAFTPLHDLCLIVSIGKK